jgi:hypothetical protein
VPTLQVRVDAAAHRLETCATINILAASPPLDGGGLFLWDKV